MKHNNWFWGVFFVLAAVLIIVNAVSGFTVIGFWTIAASVLLAAIFIQSLVKLNFFGVFVSLALAYILYQHPLAYLPVISPWLLLLAAVLVSIGFHIIFGRHTKCQYERRVDRHCEHDGGEEYRTIEDVDSNNPYVKLSLGSSSKYLHADALKSGQFYCSLGELSVYFDQVRLDPDGAEIYVDCNLGAINLYFPREWRVIDRINSSLGGVKDEIRGSRAGENSPKITVTGKVSLGGIEIKYI